ncbi:MAG: DNA methyltransferase [Candidatus Scalindua sp.]
MHKNTNYHPFQYYKTDEKLEKLFKRYENRKRPINVDFRKMVYWFSSPDRYTHMVHPYPAKLLMHIPHYFLANTLLSKPGDTVLDPFCGTGTVLLESQLLNRNALGADSNPIAQLISRVKIRPLPIDKLQNTFLKLMREIPSMPNGNPPDVVNLDYWFYPHVTKQLQRILVAIKTLRNSHFKDFFLVCFSVCVRKVSLADPRTSVPVRLSSGQYPEGHKLRDKTDAYIRRLRRINVLNVFSEIVTTNMRRMSSLTHHQPDCQSYVISQDARNLSYDLSGSNNGRSQVPSNSIQLVITSPPYAGAQKYIRSVCLSLGWLGLCSAEELSTYKAAPIGREQYKRQEYAQAVTTGIPSADRILSLVRKVNPLRAHIAGNYLVEMRQAFTETFRVLKPNGYFVLVAANNQVCGNEFKTSQYLRTIAEQLGLSLKLCLIDDIRSRGLMTKRNKTASVITREWVMVFQKGMAISDRS